MGYRNRRSSNRDRSFRGRRSMDSGSGGRRSMDSGSGGRRSMDSGPREMVKTVCSNCGKECEVPFQPTGVRPVYCSECWAERRPPRTEDSGRGRYAQERGQRSPFGGEELGTQILSELKRIREILEKVHPD